MVQVHAIIHSPLSCQGAEVLELFFCQRGQVHFLEVHQESRGFYLAEVQELVNESEQASRVALHHVHVLGDASAFQAFQGARDECQWCAYLVGDGGEEVDLALQHFAVTAGIGLFGGDATALTQAADVGLIEDDGRKGEQ